MTTALPKRSRTHLIRGGAYQRRILRPAQRLRRLVTNYDPVTLAPAPALATSWDISDDGMVYTFHLRDGVTFTDGSTFDAADVKYSFDRLADPNRHVLHRRTGPGLTWPAGRMCARRATVGEGTPTPNPLCPRRSISGVKVVDTRRSKSPCKAMPSFLKSLTLPGGYHRRRLGRLRLHNAPGLHRTVHGQRMAYRTIMSPFRRMRTTGAARRMSNGDHQGDPGAVQPGTRIRSGQPRYFRSRPPTICRASGTTRPSRSSW